MYGLETVELTNRHYKEEMGVAEMKMLKFSPGITKLDKINNMWHSACAKTITK